MDKKWIVRLTGVIVIAVILLIPAISSADLFSVGSSTILSNYPNPFDSRSEATTIIYSVASQANVKIRIYDIFGYIVRDYPEFQNISGLNKLIWDGTNENGQKVAKGGYICQIEISYGSKPIVITRKIGVIH
jgi:flagellar hook assembly protein FlgD